MQELQELMPDEETFRRVWRRVMPDEENSPLAVHPPGAGQRPPAQSRPSERPEENLPPEGDEGLLRRMLELLDGGLGRTSAVVRRNPGVRPLWDSLRESTNQARSAWFLMTGRRWQGNPGSEHRNTSLRELLREQYLREVAFSALCRQGAQPGRSEELQEIAPELERESRRRRGMIRRLLAQG